MDIKKINVVFFDNNAKNIKNNTKKEFDKLKRISLEKKASVTLFLYFCTLGKLF